MINMMKLVLMLAFGLYRARVMKRGTVEIDSCSVRATEKGVLFCKGEGMTADLSVEGCPGAQLWADRVMLVTGVRGSVDQVRLARTMLVCEDLAENATIAILNGKKCQPPSKTVDVLSKIETTTTTTAKPFPWWPFPFGLDQEAGNRSTTAYAQNTTSSTTTTTTSVYNNTGEREVSTVMIAVTAGISWNGTMIIITLGLTLTAVGAIITVRCVRKRARRGIPIQVPEVTSTSFISGPSSSRVRRRSAESYESVELFSMKHD